MDIKRAKQEIKDSIEAYLKKDRFGEYVIPPVRQRPVLLMGAPGIGKTQIMEQIARELKIGLVAYTITHHTRQSAVGLPFIKEKEFQGKKFSVTEYTMSEIIASVYEKMEKTGIKEGILFIDEINCVSETLAPMMLQFLQGKTFGNQEVPKGWIIVAAGNPPQYNKSVREFDVVTLDRLKKIEVEADFQVWKEYAYKEEIHPAVISYLELRRENFYRIENTVDGKLFVTARGWEDLARLIQVYEDLGKKADRDVVSQYIQYPVIAKDFANYLELYYKYKKDYKVEEILEGRWTEEVLKKIRAAAFDEHLSIVSLLNGKLGSLFTECFKMDAFVAKLYEYLLYYRDNQSAMLLEDVKNLAQKDMERQKKAELLTRQEEQIFQDVIDTLERYARELKGELFIGDAAFDEVRRMFVRETQERESLMEHTGEILTHVFDFMEAAFGESQEMVAFITELNANYYSVWFIKENGCDQYYKYNKGLLFDNRQQEILQQMDEAEGMLNVGIK
ncbi:AAA family ATPase [Mediterraneibacter sp. NSJ-55]|uniref:AAA family ATPase n=1 Tax=Mediterraneibacter hominis TaxID=2763054 RepID=A0A923LIF7_9FIRM|nr:AAA family ATPase [Mediterraneibacter hominis]MBC5689392.1 AAA family ATPase [Mediterraneibacter hominis]